ncbi:phosphoglucomutase/phosphomannomutase family protein [Verrucomicrobia bacterium]|nr:phosphoglucomutase/phosphomannomutase family protein [Verrucomicrobiota bacterium]
MPNTAPIQFGTSGWRGLIARDFTFDRVRLATQGIADYLKPSKSSTVIIGHDARFLGRDFALAAAEVLTANGLTPLLCDRDTPTPVISHAIRTRKAAGGISLTASHNPAEWQGLKFSLGNGAPASMEATHAVENNITRRQKEKWTFDATVTGTFECKEIDPRPAYFRRLCQLVDFDAIKKTKMKIAVELMYGAGRGYLDVLLEEAGVKVTRFHPHPNPLFGGQPPEPSAEGMADAAACVKSGKAQLALGLDGDADRFGIVDRDGTWLTPNQILALTLYHLKKNRHWTGAAVRTVPTSHMIDAIAAHLGVTLHETPVGFKYIGALMESKPIIVGGEESGGLSVKGHVPEKDGILACLLMAELVAVEKKSLGQILKLLEKQIGRFYTDRINILINPEKKAVLLKRLAKGLDKIGESEVKKFITTDGYKFLLPNNEWVAFRASGTEPVIRCYLETKTAIQMKRLQNACRKLLA